MYSDISQIPEPYRMGGNDQALQDFVGEAIRIYRERKGL
jgi:hypothetical protein